MLLSLVPGVFYYLWGSDETSGDAAVLLGACNLSMTGLYIYATFGSCGNQSDYIFKIAVYLLVLVYAAIYLFANIKIYKNFQAENPEFHLTGYIAYLSVAMIVVMVVVLLQVFRARKKWMSNRN